MVNHIPRRRRLLNYSFLGTTPLKGDDGNSPPPPISKVPVEVISANHLAWNHPREAHILAGVNHSAADHPKETFLVDHSQHRQAYFRTPALWFPLKAWSSKHHKRVCWNERRLVLKECSSHRIIPYQPPIMTYLRDSQLVAHSVSPCEALSA